MTDNLHNPNDPDNVVPGPDPILTHKNKKKPPGLQRDTPPPDEFYGRGNKKKKPGKQIPVKSQIEEQIDAALALSNQQAKKRVQRKKQFKRSILGIGLLLIAGVIYLGLKPYQGTVAFGICKVFLEGTVTYPEQLRLSTVEEFESSVRIWYTQIDSFGEYRMEPIQCYYKQDPERGTMLDRVLINRREVDPKKVERFNNALPAIAKYPVDLTIPLPLPDNLKDLQEDPGSFRKPVL
jgi:hypothetical protein